MNLPTTETLDDQDNNKSIKTQFVEDYLKSTYEHIKTVLGSRPVKTHWMLPKEDFPKKNEAMWKFMFSNNERCSITDSKKLQSPSR